MAGEVFNLGQVLQSAEQIKAMRRAPAEELLKQRYLESQIANNAQSGQLAAAQEQRAQTTAAQQAAQFSQEQQVTNTRLLNAASAEIMRNPAAMERWLPQLQQAGILPASDPNAWRNVPPEQIQAKAKEYFDSTSAAIAALNGPQKADKMPTSYEEFALSQADPAFAKFLQSRKGKGISMTMPDGTVVNIGGEGGAVSAADLSAPTKNKLQDAIIQSTDELERLNSMGEGFDPKFLQVPGRLKGATLKIKDLAGMDLNPDEQNYLTKFSTFKADAAKNLSTILNRLSGAAISPAEGERLKKGIPNDEDSPTQFVAKYRAAVKDSTRAIMRANWALKNGIGVKSVEDLSHSMPLNGIDHVFEERANDIWQQMGGTPETKTKAIQQANQEFGVAR